MRSGCFDLMEVVASLLRISLEGRVSVPLWGEREKHLDDIYMLVVVAFQGTLHFCD